MADIVSIWLHLLRMKTIVNKVYFLPLFALLIFGCKPNSNHSIKLGTSDNSIKHAQGFELYHYDNFSLLKINKPWPGATNSTTYLLHKTTEIPDSLSHVPSIRIPVKKVIATSTTHIPAFEDLDEVNALIGFPNTAYISSPKTRTRIDQGLVQDLGNNESLNIETVINLNPDILIAFGIDGNNNSIDLVEKAGIPIIYNGDWVEKSPLGKAEWIKFFGALFDKNEEATTLFDSIESSYHKTLESIKNIEHKPTVLCGAIFQDKWDLPKGDSWMTQLIKDAKGQYLWENSTGTGSLSLSFEQVYEKAQHADFWIGPSQFCSYQEMNDSYPHYSSFDAFKNKKVYSFALTKGPTGGLLFYEMAPSRPDIILKDMVKILHPESATDHELFFYQPLK